jgi:hypothetical protein
MFYTLTLQQVIYFLNKIRNPELNLTFDQNVTSRISRKKERGTKTSRRTKNIKKYCNVTAITAIEYNPYPNLINSGIICIGGDRPYTVAVKDFNRKINQNNFFCTERNVKLQK